MFNDCDASFQEEINANIINELRNFGIKFRVKKHNKHQSNGRPGRLFGRPLHLLDLAKVTLSDGKAVEVPRFLVDACQYMESHLGTEGLFRKAGSAARQKNIRLSLDTGVPLGKSHHVIDVANLLKLFLRELPEPLLPPGMFQECLLRCLLCKERRSEAILLVTLLLPTLTLHTLAFIMQFLQRVVQHSEQNKMTASNLAIVLAPGIMPPPTEQMVLGGPRLAHHVQVIQILIEAADRVGQVPPELIPQDLQPQPDLLPVPQTDKKKKKRRSASLTRMLSGFMKMVGGPHTSHQSTPSSSSIAPSTPCILESSAKKRKVQETLSAPFSAKKRREVLTLLPENSVLATPFTSVAQREARKQRSSIGSCRSGPKTIDEENEEHVERRWSVVGTPWGRKKRPTILGTSKQSQSVDVIDTISMEMPMNQFVADLRDHNKPVSGMEDKGEEFVNIPKSEYEEIKKRVSAIETRLSQEFAQEYVPRDPENVQAQYQKTLQESGLDASSDYLAKQLGRELKIRRSAEHRIIRSPSARKIGSMRRRSHENGSITPNRTNLCRSQSLQYNCEPSEVQVFLRSSLKRGQPNTVQTGLPEICRALEVPSQSGDTSNGSVTPASLKRATYGWQNAEVFFNNKKESPAVINKSSSISQTPNVPQSSTSTKSNQSVSKTPQMQFQTGRASIAKIRSQNAGMVLAKAKLFDGLLDGEPAKPLKISPKKRTVYHCPTRSNSQIPRRQKLRPVRSPLAIPVVKVTADENTTRPNLTFVTTNRNLNSNSMESDTVPSIPDNLKQVIYDACTPTTLKISQMSMTSPNNVPGQDYVVFKTPNRKRLGGKSPRRVARQQAVERRAQTPLLAVRSNIM